VARKPSPDYDLADRLALTEPSQVKAISHPVRTTILGLLHERGASVSELAVALRRPKSTVAHHVGVLLKARLVQVVGTRRVRAIEERFYGRTARMFYMGVERNASSNQMPLDFNDFEVAARESAAAFGSGNLWAFIRHGRITETQASEFWEQMAKLVAQFEQLPRSGETVYGFAVGVYPADHPALPDPANATDEVHRSIRREHRNDSPAEARRAFTDSITLGSSLGRGRPLSRFARPAPPRPATATDRRRTSSRS